ncbi:carboxypeptidase-like regulatory domain-containing protein, partial [Sulfoacidibacillus ferrooxidans]|uniref:carboxypeptidase-like regulatory domain-containing protein n=1 Tax=Sulfoacidibacillus ferrooxidans TaxID=2005001 RepID=UPI001F509926
MKKMKVTKGLVASAVVLIPLSSVSMAFASTSFDTQYQSNVSEETSLLQTAQSSSVSNPQIVALSNAVQTINTQVSALYQSEQTLANQEADMTQVNTSNDQSLQQLQQQRDQILQQSQSAWDQVNRFKNNRSSFGRRSFEHSRQDWLTIGQQLNLIDNQIRSFHDRGNQFSYHSSYNGAVSALQSSILKLQDTSIQYTNEWINLEQTETGTSGGSVGSGTLPIPIVTMNTSYYGLVTLTISNATPDATVNLYTSFGQEVSSTTADSNGNASFDNLPSGSYYVVQTYDGQQSAQSNTVTYTAQSTVATPSLVVNDNNGLAEVDVSNAAPDA